MMAGVPVPDEHEEMGGEIVKREPPEMVVRLDVPDGVTLTLIVNDVRVDLDD